MKTITYKFLILVLALLITTISIYTHALKKETKLNNQEKIKSQEETRLQEQNQKYLDIISKHSPKTPDLPRRANGEINWPEVNWFEEIILPEDYNVYKLIVKEFLDNTEIPRAYELKPKTSLLRDRKAMNYYEIPEDIQKLVEEKKYSEIPVYAKIEKVKKQALEIQNSETIPSQSSPNLFLSSKSIGEYPLTYNEKNGVGQNNTLSSLPEKEKLEEEKEEEIEIININETPKFSVKELIPSRNIGKEDIKVSIMKKNEKTIKKIKETRQNLYSLQSVPPEETIKNEKIIEYYEGIYDNTIENTLYYLSNNQNTDGSFGYKNKYENTSGVISLLTDYKKTNNKQYDKALEYLKNTEPKNNKQKAIKTRILKILGEQYQTLLDEISNKQKNNGSFPFDKKHTYGDLETTLETIKTMYEIDENNTKIAGGLIYVLLQIKEDGNISNKHNLNPNYYLINKTAQYLKPFENKTIRNSQISIKIKDKIELLLNYLNTNYNQEEETLSNTQDITDELMTLQSFKLYDKEETKQETLRQNAKLNQNFNGSFGDSSNTTIVGAEALSQSDLEITNIEVSENPENNQPINITIKVKNNAYETSNLGTLHIFIDNFYINQKDLSSHHLETKGEISIEINFDSNVTKRLIGNTEFKFYLENENDDNYENNRKSRNVNIAPNTNNIPAYPLYHTIHKNDSVGGRTYMKVNLNPKPDPNRLAYAILYRKLGGSRSPNNLVYVDAHRSTLGPFEEDGTYEFTTGVLYSGNERLYIGFSLDLTQIKISSDNTKYTGNVSGYVTLNDKKISGLEINNYELNNLTNSSGSFSYTGGNFSYENISNGTNAIWVDMDEYESIITKFTIPDGGEQEDIRIFTRLKEDTNPPIIEDLKIRNEEDLQFKSGEEKEIVLLSSDDTKIKEADFYYFDISENTWVYLGTQEPTNNSDFYFNWYIPKKLYGRGYKIKATVYDFRENSSETEWGPFEIIDSNDYIPPILDYFELYEHGYMYSYDIPFFARMGKILNIVVDTKDNEIVNEITINYKLSSNGTYERLFTDTNDKTNFTKTYKWEIPTNIQETDEAQIQVILRDSSNNETIKESRLFSIYSSRIEGEIAISSSNYKVGTNIGFDITSSSDYNLRNARVYLDCGTKREKIYEQYDNTGINIPEQTQNWNIPDNNYVFKNCYLELTLEDIHGVELKKLSESFSIVADTELPAPFNELIDIYIEDFNFPGDAQFSQQDKQIEHVKIDDNNISHTIIKHSYEYYRNTDSGEGNDTYIIENNKYYLSYSEQTNTLSPQIRVTNKNYNVLDLEIINNIPYVLLEKVDKFEKYNKYAYTYKNGNTFVEPIIFGNLRVPELKTFTKVSSEGKREMGRLGEYAFVNGYIWKLNIYSNRIERYSFSNGNVGNQEIVSLSGYGTNISNHYIKPAVDGNIIYFIGYESSKLIKLDTNNLAVTDYDIPFLINNRDEAYKTSIIIKNSKLYIFGNGKVYALENGSISEKSDITYTFGNDTVNYSGNWNDVKWAKTILAEEKIYLVFGEYLYSAKPGWTYFEILEFDTDNNTFTKNIAKTRKNLPSYEYAPDFHYIGNGRILITHSKNESYFSSLNYYNTYFNTLDISSGNINFVSKINTNGRMSTFMVNSDNLYTFVENEGGYSSDIFETEIKNLDSQVKQIIKPTFFKNDNTLDNKLYINWSYGNAYDGTRNAEENRLNNYIKRKNQFIKIYPTLGEIKDFSSDYLGYEIDINNNHLLSSAYGKIYSLNQDFTVDELLYNDGIYYDYSRFKSFSSDFLGIFSKYNSSNPYGQKIDFTIIKSDGAKTIFKGNTKYNKLALFSGSEVIFGGESYSPNYGKNFVSKINIQTNNKYEAVIGGYGGNLNYKKIDINKNKFVSIGWKQFLTIGDLSADIVPPLVRFTGSHNNKISRGTDLDLNWLASDNKNELDKYELYKIIDDTSTLITTINDTNIKTYTYNINEDSPDSVSFKIVVYDTDGNISYDSLNFDIIESIEITSFTTDKISINIGENLNFSWTTSRRDETINYKLYYKQENETNWELLFEIEDSGITSKEVSMNLPRGRYEFKLQIANIEKKLDNSITIVKPIPEAIDDEYTVSEGETFTGNIFLNDINITNLSNVILITDVSNGNLSFGSEGIFTYIHSGTETTTDSFSYKINDDGLESAIANVNIIITPVNDKPIINITNPNREIILSENSYTITWLDNDPDSDAKISLYYNTNNINSLGTLIVDNISENSYIDSYVWDTSNIPRGNYYIYAIIDDSESEPTISINQYSIKIEYPKFFVSTGGLDISIEKGQTGSQVFTITNMGTRTLSGTTKTDNLPDWIEKITPTEFNLSESDSVDIKVNFTTIQSGTTTNITIGNYIHNLEITSNDPDNLRKIIPINIEIREKEPPQIVFIPDKTYRVGEYFSIDLGQYVSGVEGESEYILGGRIPDGLNFDATNGELSGIINIKGSSDFSLKVRNNSLESNTKNFNIIIIGNPPIIGNIGQKSFPTTSYLYLDLNKHIIKTEDDKIISYTLNGTLPNGLSFDENIGIINGTPNEGGEFSFSLKVSDTDGESNEQSFVMYISQNIARYARIYTNVPDIASNSKHATGLFADALIDGNTTPRSHYYPINTQGKKLSIELDKTYHIDKIKIHNGYDLSLCSFCGERIVGSQIRLLDSSNNEISSQTITNSGYEVDMNFSHNSSNNKVKYVEIIYNNTSFYQNIREIEIFPYFAPQSLSIDIPNKLFIPGTYVNFNLKHYTNKTAGDTITYSLNGTLPEGLSFDDNSGLLSGISNENGLFNLEITAINQIRGISVQDSFIIGIIEPININISDQQTTPGTIFRLDLNDYVEDGDSNNIIGYTMKGSLPTGLSFDETNGIISGTARGEGIYRIYVGVNDYYNRARGSYFDISLDNSPILYDIPDKNYKNIEEFSIDLSEYVKKSDLNPEYRVYIKNLDVAWWRWNIFSINKNTGLINGRLRLGTYEISVYISDSNGISKTVRFKINVSLF